VLECTAREESETLDLEILDLDYFDDDALVMVVRTKGEPDRNASRPNLIAGCFNCGCQDRAFIATVMYRDVEYSTVSEHDRVYSREGLLALAMGQVESGRVRGFICGDLRAN
jgi:hypothetical protein